MNLRNPPPAEDSDSTRESPVGVANPKELGVLNALAAHIALLDGQGTIVSVNDAWRRFARENALRWSFDSVGANYLVICDAAVADGFGPDAAADSATARCVADGIRSVLAGRVNHFSLDYPCHSTSEQRWFRMSATHLTDDDSKGAVVMHVDVTSERSSQESLRVSESRFRQMADVISDCFFLQSLDGSEIYYASPAYERMSGRACASLYDKSESYLLSVHPQDRALVETALRAGRDTGVDCEHRLIARDGAVRWIRLRAFPILDETGAVYRSACVASDITASKDAESKVGRLNRVYAMLSGINSLIARVRDRDELYREACRIAVEVGRFSMTLIGFLDPHTLEGRVVARFGGEPLSIETLAFIARAEPLDGVRPVICNDVATDPQAAVMRTELLARGYKSVGCFPLISAGKQRAVFVLFAGETGVFDAAETVLLQQLTSDISFALDHLDNAAKLHYAAYYDSITGLANRRLFLERVAQSLRSAGAGQKIAVLCFDLERFKNINDTIGQVSGDALLCRVAQWLTADLGDANLLARVGADHFAAVLPQIGHEEEVARRLENTLQAFMDHEFKVSDHSLRIAAKVGVALFPDDGSNAGSLFANAEAALKKAKASGDRYLFYAQKMTETVAGRLVMEFRLRQALENREFILHYQPKINIASGKLTGAEALLRWLDPRKGLVPPQRFIPILEDTGLIFAVGHWALQMAVADSLRWRAAGHPVIRVAVNVSALQLRNRAFIAEIEEAVSVERNAAAGLELEITESVVMGDIQRSNTSLQAIRAMGVKIAIDDFGTGFSSLSYLAKLPVDTLKIDRSFIVEMTTGTQGLTLVSTIINLAHSLKLNVVAEGVETEEQLQLLRLLNCDEMQGWLFSKALPVEDFETLLRSRA